MELSCDIDLLGQFHRRQGNGAAAREHFQTVLQLRKDIYAMNPQDSYLRHRLMLAYTALGASLERLNDWPAAEACYREALSRIPVPAGGKDMTELDLPLFWIHSGHAFLLKRQSDRTGEACRHLEMAERHYKRIQARGEKLGGEELARGQAVREAVAACSELKQTGESKVRVDSCL